MKTACEVYWELSCTLVMVLGEFGLDVLKEKVCLVLGRFVLVHFYTLLSLASHHQWRHIRCAAYGTPEGKIEGPSYTTLPQPPM